MPGLSWRGDETIFRVADDFTRLRKTSFTTGVPAGVERVEYEINLNTFNHLIVARHAAD